jgi:ADP-ribosylglycohydrolase
MKILDGIIGLCVGDALGVPVEFTDRESLQRNPVTDMQGYGTYNQPPGTWSDDTSMTLCLLDSLTKGLDYYDIMRKFIAWYNKAEYTAHSKVFDIGFATKKALNCFVKYDMEPIMCGGIEENDNGNGSLMRILPIAFYLQAANVGHDETFDIIHDISALTHAHDRSKIACGIYVSIAQNLINCPENIKSGIYGGIKKAKSYYESKQEYVEELKHYNRIFNDDFINLPQDEIKSSGYVVHTLEAALWCLLNTDSYENCVLKAVNLGEDTDTVAAVAGGLAGIYYGYNAIPKKWINQIARLNYIEKLCKEVS